MMLEYEDLAQFVLIQKVIVPKHRVSKLLSFYVDELDKTSDESEDSIPSAIRKKWEMYLRRFQT